MTDWLWYDKTMGSRGNGAWFFVLAPVVFAYVAYTGISLTLIRDLRISTTIISIIVFIFGATMVVLYLVCIARTTRTAQRIHIIDGGYRVHCYIFGRSFHFYPSDVSYIKSFRLKGVNVPTLLSSKNTNYQVYLANGSNFYLNGAVEGTERLVAELNGADGLGSS